MRLKQSYQDGAVEQVQPRAHHPNLGTNPSHHRNLDAWRQPCLLRTLTGEINKAISNTNKHVLLGELAFLGDGLGEERSEPNCCCHKGINKNMPRHCKTLARGLPLDPARPGPSQARCRALTLTWKVDEVPPATLGDDHTRWSLCELRE